MKPEYAISIRQPWAWLILHGKDIENRTWKTNMRGPVYLHASATMTRRDYDTALVFLCQRGIPLRLPRMADIQRGGIIGQVDITGCVTESLSPWFVGPYGFTLSNAQELPFQPLKGALGFFEVPFETLSCRI